MHDIARQQPLVLNADAPVSPDAELLIRLLDGTLPPDALKPIAVSLLDRFGDIVRVLAVAPDVLAGSREPGPKVLERLRTAREVNLRLARQGAAFPIGNGTEAYARARMAGLSGENLLAMFFNPSGALLRDEILIAGEACTTLVRPRRLLHRALDLSAAALLVAHNHPSGDPSPSGADLAFTRDLVHAARLLDLRIIDHLILGAHECVSLRKLGLL